VLFTPSARNQLLELVAAMVRENRDRAARFLNAVEARLDGLAESAGEDDAVAPADQMMEEGGVRLCYWVRAEALWACGSLLWEAVDWCRRRVDPEVTP